MLRKLIYTFSFLVLRSFCVVGFLFTFSLLLGQYVPTHLSHTGIYDFMDELATTQVIDLNTSLKPYSRKLIAEKLQIAATKQEELSARQKHELDFYLKDYSKASSSVALAKEEPNTAFFWLNKPDHQRLDFFHYRDSSFQLTVNPILGTDTWVNTNGFFYHWWNGVETHATKGNFALFASLRDNHESLGLTNRDFMNQRIGASNIKGSFAGKRDYWEIRAGVTYAWDWGHIGLLMDQFSWGDASNGSNIFSGRTPAFTRLDLQMNPAKWLQFNYVHGWLVSEVVDSTLSFWVNNAYGSEYREVYHPKYMAANMFTFEPFKRFHLAVGNSIIYDARSPHAAFFVPVMFWKALDHTLNARIDNMNSQLFFTASSRNLKGFHFYTSIFIDEVQVARIFNPDDHNPVSYKFGLSTNRIKNTNFILEYTWSNTLIYRHYVPTTTFESNMYNLGHFLEDNAQDIYVALEYKPLRTLKLKGYYNYALKGPDHTLLGTTPRTTMPLFDPIVWESTRIGLSASMQVINDLYLRLGYEWRNVSGDQDMMDMWTPEVYHGQTGTVNVGVNYGF